MSRLALFMPNFAGGGAERVMLTLAGAFAADGLAVDLVVCRADGPLRRDVPESVEVVNLGAGRIGTSLVPLIRYLRSRRPEAMLSALTPTNAVALLARRLSGVPLRLVVTEHTTQSQAVRRSRDPRIRILTRLMRWTYPMADRVVAVSDGVARDVAVILRIPEGSIRVIPNPAVTSRLRALAGADLDDPWVRNRDRPLIVSAGRFVAAKDFATLISAVAAVNARRRVRLVLLGEGEGRAALEAQVEALDLGDAVRLPGFAENPFAWFAAADLFVCSSRWEGFAMVIVEALACGTQVVSTDCPNGPREILRDGALGRLVPVGDAAALAAAIEAALDDPMPPAGGLDAYEPAPIARRYLAELGLDGGAS